VTNNHDAPQGSSGWFFNHLPVILWHRRNFVIWPFVLLTVAAAIAAFTLPTLYRSSASLLVQSQGLPTELVKAPAAGDIEQRIARIRERVLSRGDLIQLIEQNNLYPKERRSKPLSKVVEKMRDATTVGAQANDLGGQQAGDQDTIAIDMSFDYPDPAQAQAVLQSFVKSAVSKTKIGNCWRRLGEYRKKILSLRPPSRHWCRPRLRTTTVIRTFRRRENAYALFSRWSAQTQIRTTPE
jgi:uncharacterized protein involved in exopolysaccharide biosynthesis